MFFISSPKSAPLYDALGHGALAGKHQLACDEIYWPRIQRGREAYSTNTLGAVASDLGAMACFFDRQWDRLARGLSEKDQAWLLNESAARLRGLGRLTDAAQPFQASLELCVRAEIGPTPRCVPPMSASSS